MPNPVRQCRSLESGALARIDRGLPVKRQVIGIFGHQSLAHYGKVNIRDSQGTENRRSQLRMKVGDLSILTNESPRLPLKSCPS